MRIVNMYTVRHLTPWYVSAHSHAFHELVYCLDGAGYVGLDGKKERFGTGNYYITHADTPHTERDDRACRIIYFYFDAPAQDVPMGAFTDYDGRVLSAVKKLLDEWQKNLAEKQEMLQSLLGEVLILARRAAAAPADDISTAIQYINSHLEETVDFKQLAAKHNYSYDRFRHLFKAQTGMSPHRFVLNARLEKAKFLMELNPRLSLTDIAYTCGFSSASQFSNAFRAKVGVSPSAYKKHLSCSNENTVLY